jgi:protein-arginine kinase activator protein McsA
MECLAMNDMRQINNFFDKLMNNGYEILVKENINWPKDLTVQQRIQLLNAAIEYFLQTEEYEKCAVLKKQIDRVVEEYNTPAKKRTRRPRKKKSEQTLTVNEEWD